MPTKKIRTFERVFTLAERKKSIYVTLWKRPTPAAMLSHWPAVMLRNHIKNGNLFEYKPKQKKV